MSSVIHPLLRGLLVAKTIGTEHSNMKEQKRQTEKRGETILNSGLGWTFSAQLGQLKIGQGGKELLRHLWCHQRPSNVMGENKIECTGAELVPHSSSARIDKPNIAINQKHETYKKNTTLEYSRFQHNPLPAGMSKLRLTPPPSTSCMKFIMTPYFLAALPNLTLT